MLLHSAGAETALRSIVVGAGLMGARRALALARLEDVQVAYICDPDRERGEVVAARVTEQQEALCQWTSAYQLVKGTDRIDLAIVAVPHDIAVSIVPELLDQDIHTLVEKPMGRNLQEAIALAAAAEASAARLAVGFNYRHYPAVVAAKTLIEAGAIGSVRLVRMIMGHGARPDFEHEWKARGNRSGGGVLLDPGIHLIDLAHFLIGELSPVQAHTARVFWPMDIEDVAQVVLESEGGATISIQTSLVEWRNQFSVHLFGDEGYLKIDGRMGTYGPQVLTRGKRWAWLDGSSQASTEIIENFGDEDLSIDIEVAAVVDAIRHNLALPADHRDGLAAMCLVARLYAQAESRVQAISSSDDVVVLAAAAAPG